jgi:hypothetical protein
LSRVRRQHKADPFQDLSIAYPPAIRYPPPSSYIQEKKWHN